MYRQVKTYVLYQNKIYKEYSYLKFLCLIFTIYVSVTKISKSPIKDETNTVDVCDTTEEKSSVDVLNSTEVHYYLESC